MDQTKRKQLTKETIEAAALRCFADKSFENVTMDEIAAVSNYTKRTIYNYFPSKAALISSIFEYRLQHLLESEKKALSKATSAKECVEILFTVVFHFSLENVDFMRMYWNLNTEHAVNELAPETAARIKALNDQLIIVPAAIIEQFPLTGIMSDYSPKNIVRFISAINKGLILQEKKETALHLQNKEPGLDKFALKVLLNSFN